MAELGKSILQTNVKSSSIDFKFEPFTPVLAKGLINAKGYFLALIGNTGSQAATVHILQAASNDITASDITVTFSSDWNAHIALNGAISIIG